MRVISIVLFALLVSCRTTAPQDEASLRIKSEPPPAPDSLLLEKIVGALSAEETKESVSHCKLLARDVKQLDQVLVWLRELGAAKQQTAMHFRATVPSIEVYGYLGARQILIYRDYSTLDFPAAAVADDDPMAGERHPSSKLLMDLISQLCSQTAETSTP